MGADDKIQNKAEELAGRGKEAAGAAMDDDEMRSEGKADQTKAKVKDKVEQVKDKITDKVDDIM